LAFAGLRLGAYAEYTYLPDNGRLAIKPANITYEEAATIPLVGIEALHSLRKGYIQNGEKVLIVGAGGSISTYGVRLAKYFGAEVTGGMSFIGRVLVKELAQRGIPTRVLVRQSSDITRLQLPGVEFVPGDVTDPQVVLAGMEGCQRVNRDGTGNVLQAAQMIEEIVTLLKMSCSRVAVGFCPQEV